MKVPIKRLYKVGFLWEDLWILHTANTHASKTQAQITRLKINRSLMRAVLQPTSLASKFPKESKSLKIFFSSQYNFFQDKISSQVSSILSLDFWLESLYFSKVYNLLMLMCDNLIKSGLKSYRPNLLIKRNSIFLGKCKSLVSKRQN